MKSIMNDVSRMQRLKARQGIHITQATSLKSYKEMSTLKRDIDSAYKEISEELLKTHKRTSKRSVEDWINTIPVMKALTYNKVKTQFEEEGIYALILTFVPHQEL